MMAVTTLPDTPSGASPPMTSSHPQPVRCQWFSWLAAALDRRSAPTLALVFLGAVLARGRLDRGGQMMTNQIDAGPIYIARRAHQCTDATWPSREPRDLGTLVMNDGLNNLNSAAIATA